MTDVTRILNAISIVDRHGGKSVARRDSFYKNMPERKNNHFFIKNFDFNILKKKLTNFLKISEIEKT